MTDNDGTRGDGGKEKEKAFLLIKKTFPLVSLSHSSNVRLSSLPPRRHPPPPSLTPKKQSAIDPRGVTACCETIKKKKKSNKKTTRGNSFNNHPSLPHVPVLEKLPAERLVALKKLLDVSLRLRQGLRHVLPLALCLLDLRGAVRHQVLQVFHDGIFWLLDERATQTLVASNVFGQRRQLGARQRGAANVLLALHDGRRQVLSLLRRLHVLALGGEDRLGGKKRGEGEEEGCVRSCAFGRLRK